MPDCPDDIAYLTTTTPEPPCPEVPAAGVGDVPLPPPPPVDACPGVALFSPTVLVGFWFPAPPPPKPPDPGDPPYAAAPPPPPPKYWYWSFAGFLAPKPVNEVAVGPAIAT